MYQSGFRMTDSTDLSGSIDRLCLGMDQQMYTCMILVDPQKASGNLDHGVLCEKRKYFGFRAWGSFWFVLMFFSETGALKYSVPKDSIVELLLFLLHVNDLPQSS